MRPYVIIMAVALSAGLLFSCKADDQVHISGIVEHVDAEDVLLLKRLEFSTETLIDTLRTDEEGRFKYILKKGIEQPGYYYYLSRQQAGGCSDSPERRRGDGSYDKRRKSKSLGRF